MREGVNLYLPKKQETFDLSALVQLLPFGKKQRRLISQRWCSYFRFGRTWRRGFPPEAGNASGELDLAVRFLGVPIIQTRE
jgi:hypothetical protein